VSIITLVLLIAAFILFLLATFSVGSRFNLIAAGLACWVLTQILPALHG
jgi:hypothetical protein